MTPIISRMHRFLSVACVFLAGHVAAQQTNKSPARSITLQECIEMALEQNLDLRIERINPLLSRLDVEIGRAAYDPNFIFSASRSRVKTLTDPGRVTNLVSTNLVFFSDSSRTTDELSSSIGGRGPLGMSYNLAATLVDGWGKGFDEDGRLRTEGADGSLALDITQPLLRNFLIDETRLNIQVARIGAQSSEWAFRNQIIATITAVEQAYYELIFSRENVKVQQEGLRLAERLYADDVKRMEIGMIPRLDEKQSESQVAARQADMSTALRSLATAQNNLKRLITSDYRDLHQVSLQPTEALTAVSQGVELYESWGKGLEWRPDLRQQRLALEQEGIVLKFRKNQRLPQLDLEAGYGYRGTGARGGEFSDAVGDIQTGDRPAWSVGGVFSIPLANKAARDRYRQQRLTVDQALLSLKRQEEIVLVEIDEAVNSVRTSYDRVQSTRKARQFAEEALTAEQQKLQSGKSTSFVVLQLQRDLTSARSEEIRALADYNNALAELHRAEGTTLERKKITLKTK